MFNKVSSKNPSFGPEGQVNKIIGDQLAANNVTLTTTIQGQINTALTTTTTAVTTAQQAILDQMKVYHFPPFSGGYGRSGVPDIIACIDGRFVGIECKAGKNKPTALQEKEMQKIRDAGGVTFVVNEDNINEVATYLQTKA